MEEQFRRHLKTNYSRGSLNKLLLVIIIIELLIILVDKLKDVVPVQLILG